MAENKHINYFKVENFKRFESLEVQDIGQFNLIVGDNNVGKTSLLEALLVDDDGQVFLDSLFYVLTFIKKFDNLFNTKNGFLDYYLLVKTKPEKLIFTLGKDTNKRIFILEDRGSNGNLFWNLLGIGVSIVSPFTNHITYSSVEQSIPFIPLGFAYDHDITKHYSTNIQRSSSKKEKFIDGLKNILPSIKSIEVNAGISSEPVILIGRDGMDELMPLGTFGDGFLKMFRLLISFIVQADNRLMIDEIDTGIHYSRMKEFMKSLIQLAVKNNVQLFATTHSKECLQYYQEALEELGLEEKARVIRLVEHKDKNVKAYTYNFAQFEQSLDNENEIR